MKTFITYLIALSRFKTSRLEPISTISLDSRLEGNNLIGSGCKILSSSVGKYTYIGNNSTLMLAKVSQYVSIAPSAIIGLQGHDLDRLSTFPPFWYSNQSCSRGLNSDTSKKFAYQPSFIEADAWIGHSVLVKAGVTISTGSVVGAGSVVTKDLEPYGVYVGSPARLIKFRFNDQIISDLLSSKWWNLDFTQAKAFLLEFESAHAPR